MLKHVMTPKSSSWRQKRVMTSKSPSWRQKYVMTSNVKTRHDIKKSPWRQKYVKSTSWPLTNRPTVNEVWYRPVDTHIRTNTHIDRHTNTSFSIVSLARLKTDTHTNASITITSLYWWISSSVLTNSCINGEIWSYTWQSPVRNYGQFVLYCVSWCSQMQNRYCTQYKSRSILLKPWFV